MWARIYLIFFAKYLAKWSSNCLRNNIDITYWFELPTILQTQIHGELVVILLYFILFFCTVSVRIFLHPKMKKHLITVNFFLTDMSSRGFCMCITFYFMWWLDKLFSEIHRWICTTPIQFQDLKGFMYTFFILTFWSSDTLNTWIWRRLNHQGRVLKILLEILKKK